MSSTIGPETAVLTLARFSLFYACRKYLLRSLYSDLKSLSTSATSVSSATLHRSRSHTQSPLPPVNDGQEVGAGIELDILPPPATQTPKSGRFMIEDAAYLHTSVSRTIFSWCFAESCMLFFLLMLQGWGVFSSEARHVNWRFSLLFLMCAILVVIPLVFTLLLSLAKTTQRPHNRNPFTSFRTIIALVTVGFYLFALSYIPIPPSLNASDTFTVYLSRLIVLGTVILGLLSGFGAISNSWQFLPLGSKPEIEPTEQDIDTAQFALTSVRNDIQQRMAEASRRKDVAKDASWISRVGKSFRGDDLAQELQGLETLEYQMNRNLEALRERYQAAQFAKTFKGTIFNIFGKLFTAYCITRIIGSIYNVIFLHSRRSSSSTTYPDIFTNLLSLLFSHLSSSSPHAANVKYEDLAAVARQLSLVLVGLIILSSIRLVLRGVVRVLSVTNRSLAASLMMLVLAQIMGIYLLSTLVQMRSSFPPPPPPPLPSHDRSPSSPSPSELTTQNLFTTIPAYEVFGFLFDWSFLLAAGASIVIRWGAEKVLWT